MVLVLLLPDKTYLKHVTLRTDWKRLTAQIKDVKCFKCLHSFSVVYQIQKPERPLYLKKKGKSKLRVKAKLLLNKKKMLLTLIWVCGICHIARSSAYWEVLKRTSTQCTTNFHIIGACTPPSARWPGCMAAYSNSSLRGSGFPWSRFIRGSQRGRFCTPSYTTTALLQVHPIPSCYALLFHKRLVIHIWAYTHVKVTLFTYRVPIFQKHHSFSLSEDSVKTFWNDIFLRWREIQIPAEI